MVEWTSFIEGMAAGASLVLIWLYVIWRLR
jgi:hypothetical protein